MFRAKLLGVVMVALTILLSKAADAAENLALGGPAPTNLALAGPDSYENLALAGTATASSYLGGPGPWYYEGGEDDYGAANANDGDLSTIWHNDVLVGGDPWIAIGFPTATTFDRVTIYERDVGAIGSWTLQYDANGTWVNITSGTGIGVMKNIGFDAVTSTGVRLLITSRNAVGVNIFEFEVHSGTYATASSYLGGPGPWYYEGGEDDYGAANANDGDLSTIWHNDVLVGGDPWIAIGFPTDTTFNRVSIYERDWGAIGSWILQYDANGTWVNITSGTGIGWVKNIDFDAVTSKGVRLLITSRNARGVNIFEFEVYNRVATDAPAATASSYLGGPGPWYYEGGKDDYGPANANDGDLSTIWHNDVLVGGDPWIAIGFPTATTFNRVTIYERDVGAIGSWTLQYDANGTWVNITSGIGIGAMKNIAFDTCVTSRDVRLLITSRNARGVNIFEFEVYYLDTTPPTITAPDDVEACPAAGVVLGTPTVSDNCDPSPVVTNDAPSAFLLGDTLVTWTATDASGNWATDTQVVTVVDITPPEVLINNDNENIDLWPPDHRWVTIPISVNDECAVTVVVDVTNSEAGITKGAGGPQHDPDVVIANDNSYVQVRAERSGTGAGRLYTITVTATDAGNNVTTESVNVTVGHDRRKKL